MSTHESSASVRVLVFTIFYVLAASATAAAGRFLSVVETLRDVPIETPRQFLVSGDDRFLYVLGDSALAVFERDAATGLVAFVEAYIDGYGGVAGIAGATSMVLSPDDRFLYAGSPQHRGGDGDLRGAVAIFERNPADGKLRPVDVETAGFTGAGGPAQSLHLALTSGGVHLYASSTADGAVLVFTRDATDGGLSFAGAVSENVESQAFRLSAVLDSGNRNLYLAQATLTTDLYEKGRITVFARDAAGGGLTFVEEHVNRTAEVVDMDIPTGAIVSPDGAHLYVMNGALFPYDGDDGALVAFRRDPASGRLTHIGPQDYPASPTGGAWDVDGTRLYVTGAAGGIDVALSEVLIYARDAADGTLERVARIREDREQELLGYPSPLLAMAFSGDRKNLYAGIFNSKLVAVWELAADGGLRPVDDPNDPSGGRGVLRGASRAAVSPDGRHVYVTNTASGGLAVYERDPETGRLGLLDVVRGPYPQQDEPVAVSSDGRWVYALGSVFARGRESGLLQRVPQPDFNVSLFGDDLVPSPDGRHLYVLRDSRDSPVAGYAQTAGGRLRQISFRIPPPAGRGRLSQATSAAMSADGAYLFAVGTFLSASPGSRDIDAVWAFARDPVSGRLTLETFAEIGPRVFDLRRLAVSPNGRHVYVVERESGDLMVFRHHRGTKRLELVERRTDGEGGVVGMVEPSDVAVSDSGHLVYVAGSGSDAVAVFAREDGQLAFQDAVRGGPGGELVRPQALAVAPGNRHLYVTSERLAAVSALTLDCLGGPDELCLDGERFRVDVTWRDGRGEGVGHRVPLRSRNSGVFWFFSSDNWEMLVKVLDGCQLNGRFWVFAAVTTAVGYDLRVTDTWTGEVTSYLNPLGTASPAITDTDALHGCGVAHTPAEPP